MRIRSIKPEFWRSSDISSLDWETRLLFIGLWSYVDDNGVGIDKLSAIAADLFADDVERDPRETFASVSRGLQTLSDSGRITRYKVDKRNYLCITNWDRHQRIDKPNKARYPLPTCEDAEIRESVARVSRECRETPAPGTEEQRNRGTVLSCPSAIAEGEIPELGALVEPDDNPHLEDIEIKFGRWWSNYPRKVGKGTAFKAFKKALKTATVTDLIAAVDAQKPNLLKDGPDFCPYPATWLNGERWLDESVQAPAVTYQPRYGAYKEPTDEI